MSEAEIKQNISLINNSCQKPIKTAYEKSKKIRIAIQKQKMKIIGNAEKLIEETDPQLTEEGVKKITKKGKIYFRSLKAFNPFLHEIHNQTTKLSVPSKKKQLTSTELSNFIRSISRMINDVNKEKAKVDSVMGLDFMLKKRGMYGALGNINSELVKLRELQEEEYSIIKALEDLDSLGRDVNKTQENIERIIEEISDLEKQLESSLNVKTEKEGVKTSLLKNPTISNSRIRTIRLTELEIEIGKQLNSFKKTFKKFARETQRGSVSSDFGIVSTAIGYEKNPVQKFLEETDANSEILTLLQELINLENSSLNLKQKDINNLRRVMKNIQAGKNNDVKNEWHELSKKKKKDDSSPEFNKINNELTKCEEEIEEINKKINQLEEGITLRKKEHSNLIESIEERKSRAVDITTKAINFQN
ncbi:MAG: hypothetical protein ACTSQH_03435 [Candidatus Hodarchaeales archaeon]